MREKLFEKVDTEPEIVHIEKTFGLIKTNIALIYGTMLSAFILSPERNLVYTGLATVSSILMLYIFLDLRTIYLNHLKTRYFNDEMKDD